MSSFRFRSSPTGSRTARCRARRAAGSPSFSAASSSPCWSRGCAATGARSRRWPAATALPACSTGAPSRAAIEAECARAGRSREPLSVVYLDIDRFKAINDRFGHGAGDQVLRQLAAGIGATIRTHIDSGYRLGGDEFALLLPSTTKGQAEAVVSRLRSFCAVHDPRWAVGAFDLSAGVVDLEPGEAATALLARGDAAMYAEKYSRRAALH